MPPPRAKLTPFKKDQNSAVLPDPEELGLEAETCNVLIEAGWKKILSLISPAILMDIGIRELSVQTGLFLISPYEQYLIRIMACYYQQLPIPADPYDALALAHYTWRAESEEDVTETSVEFGGLYSKICEFGIKELTCLLARVILGENVQYFLNPCDAVAPSSMESTIAEVAKRYGDLLVILKLLGRLVEDDDAIFSLPIQYFTYVPEFELYMEAICEGYSNLDGVRVGLHDRYAKETPEEVANRQEIDHTKTVTGKITINTRMIFGDKKAKISTGVNQDESVHVDAGKTQVVRDTTKFRRGISTFADLAKLVDQLEQTVKDLVETTKDIKSVLNVVITQTQNRTLADQHKYSETLFDKEKTDDQRKEKTETEDREKIMAVAVKLRNVKISEINEVLVARVKDVLTKFGREDLSKTLNVNVLKMVQARARRREDVI